MKTTIGQVMVNEALPEEYRDYTRSMGKGDVDKLLTELAHRDPEKYKDVSFKLMQLGANAAYHTGFTLSLSDLLLPIGKEKVLAQLAKEKAAILRDKTLSNEEKDLSIQELYLAAQKKLSQDTMTLGAAANNPFAMQVKSKARGSPQQLSSLLTTPGVYTDSEDKMVPVFIQRSHAEGLTPAEYWASSFGSRKSVVSTKFCLAAGTLVTLEDGRDVPIESVRPGDKVRSRSQAGYNSLAPVIAVHSNGKRDCFRYTFHGQYEECTVVCTPNHKFLTMHLEMALTLVPISEVVELNLQVVQMFDDNYSRFVNVAENPSFVGELDTYDLEVDTDEHVFCLSNGLVVSNSTAKGGYLGKQFTAAGATQVVTRDDCETPHGVPVSASDDDNVGSVLARPAGGFGAGTLINKEVQAQLREKKVDDIVVRSPLTCALPEGLCKKCVGARETGKLPQIGDHIGYNAMSALAERITQSALNQKHCVDENTLVRMSDWSVKSIKDITPGEYVMGSDKSGRLFPTQVINVFNNGLRDCYETQFIINGFHRINSPRINVTSTLDHELLATRLVVGQKEEALNHIPRMIKIGQKSRTFQAVLPSAFDDTGCINEPLALAIGLVLGDGCYTKSVSGVYFSTADETLKNELVEYFDSLGLRLKKLIGHQYYHRISGKKRPSISARDAKGHALSVSKNAVLDYLRDNGMYGKYSYEKVLPASVSRWDNASVAALITGLAVTDGCIYMAGKQPAFRFTSTSQVLVTQLRDLLAWRFGIWSQVMLIDCEGKRHGAFIHRRNAYALGITRQADMQRFREVIPLLGDRKQRLDKYMASYTPAAIAQHSGRAVRISQTFVGQRPTYDLEVNNADHLFVLANGLIVSNSSGQKGSYSDDYGGFDVINSMAQVPKNFPHRAALAEAAGTISAVRPAAQGGNYVYVNDQEHYVLPDMEVTVKPGDKVEAGDVLSSGLPNPSDIVRLKGIGDGRRYFMNRFTKALRDSGYEAHRRNVEVLTRALINHVEVEDPNGLGDRLPGDVVQYNALANEYRPRPDAAASHPSAAIGKYLEAPVLHYSIGTKLTKPVATELAKFGVDTVMTHPKPVGFQPVMQSLVKVPAHFDDWMARLSSNYLKTRLLEDVQTGATSDFHGVHPLPALAKGLEFGRPSTATLKEKGFSY